MRRSDEMSKDDHKILLTEIRIVIGDVEIEPTFRAEMAIDGQSCKIRSAARTRA